MLWGHIVVEGSLECLTGLHIGASNETIEIGGIDAPVVRNPVTREPYIPGSSFKGKMRSLLEKWKAPDAGYFNRNGGGGCKRHECDKQGDALKCEVCSLFGSTAKGNDGSNNPGLLLVSDCELENKKEMKRDGLYITEAKMENALDRITSAAHPRTIERVPAGAHFRLKLILRVEPNNEAGVIGWQRHLDDLFTLLHLIEKDGMGGHVSRGYGQVKFEITCMEGFRVDNSSADGLLKSDRNYTLDECREAIASIQVS